MANSLRTKPKVISRSHRLADDMPVRNSALLDDRIVQNVIWAQENPMSPVRMFGGGFSLFSQSSGIREGVTEQAPGVELVMKGTGLNFVGIKELSQESDYTIVVDSSNVKDVIVGGEQFEVALNKPYDRNEQLMDREGKYTYFVVSTQYSAGVGYIHTLNVIGRPDNTYTGLRRLFAQGATFKSIGNAFTEASRDSNTLHIGPQKASYVYNPMKVQRYKTSRTGFAMSDKLYEYKVRMEDGEIRPWYLRLPEETIDQSLRKIESSLVHSQGAFDPDTLEITQHAQGTDYSEVGIYSGIREQLSNVRVKYSASVSFSHEKKLRVLENMYASMVNAGFISGGKVAIIALGAAAKKWVQDALLKGGLERTREFIQFNKEVGPKNSVTTGITLDSHYFFDGTEAVIYDMASNMFGGGRTAPGEAKFSYDGIDSPYWTNKIYFMPLTSGGQPTQRRRATLYTKEAIDPITGQKINRGFVFGRVGGFTGAGSPYSADRMAGATDEQYVAEFVKAMKSGAYDVGSPVDADEYHIMTDHTIYLDITGMVELTLTRK